MISVIIPALNEEQALPATLEQLFRLKGHCEVILVDGGSTDQTRQVAAQWPQVRILQSAAGRGRQMNEGAAVARGNILLFLHADTLLPESALTTLNENFADPNIEWGGFRHRFSGSGLALRFISWLTNTRCLITRIFYGDQAMFVRRSVFEEMGGYPDAQLEDITLSKHLRRRSKPLFLELQVITDSRKFEQMGPVRSLTRCLLILICYGLRLPLLGQRFFTPVR
ncbi:MAG: TIGR04283 family arsenosugar biosynthesis glycosyltransferase [Gammaproteobacteria bacterium]